MEMSLMLLKPVWIILSTARTYGLDCLIYPRGFGATNKQDREHVEREDYEETSLAKNLFDEVEGQLSESESSHIWVYTLKRMLIR